MRDRLRRERRMERLAPRVTYQPIPKRITVRRYQLSKLYRPTVVRPNVHLREIEDRRRFHPLRRAAPAATFSRRDQRRIVEKYRAVQTNFMQAATLDPFVGFSQPSVSVGLPAGRPAFAVPKKVAVCVRRHQRREAIFAKGHAGKGAAQKRRRQSEFSNIGC